MFKFIINLLGLLGLFLILVLLYLFVGEYPARQVEWGVAFSTKQAQLLSLDWQTTYSAILDELKPKNLRLVAYWDELESQPGQFDFSKLDWQLVKANEHQANVILTIGRKLPRWPECHLPMWFKDLPALEQQQAAVKTMLS